MKTDDDKIGQAVLTMVADHPASVGRIVSARVVLRYSCPQVKFYTGSYQPVGISPHIKIKQAVAIIDRMIDAGLLASTEDLRPRLVLTRLGFAALMELEAC